MNRFWAPGLGRYILRHPSSALPLALAGWRLRRRGWCRSAPFLPLPPVNYWAFRTTTVSGSSGSPLSPEAMVDAAKWSLRQSVGR